MARNIQHITAALACSLLFATVPAAAQPAGKTLVIASFGGQLDEAFRTAMTPFLSKAGVRLRFVPGTAAENAAKIVATKNSPEYDMVFLENMTQELVSRQDLLAKLDPNTMPNYKDLVPKARLSRVDGVPVGFYFTGFYYNPKEFEARKWAIPTSWNDLFRPEFCNHVGVMHPNVSYSLHTLLMLAGGEPQKMPEGIARSAQLKDCVATLEPSSSKLEEKIQLGEYLVGTHGTIRAVPLIEMGYPIKFRIPDEGSILAYSVVVMPKNSREPALVRDVMNHLIGPDAQKVFMEMAFYTPTNSTVQVSPKLIELGVPDNKMMDKILTPSDAVLNDRRRDWVRQLERAMAR